MDQNISALFQKKLVTKVQRLHFDNHCEVQKKKAS